MPYTFQRRFTFQIDSPTNQNIIIIWMCFLFTCLCLQMTVQLYFNDFAITIRAIYFYLISCSAILFQPISIVLSILFILFLQIVFMGFIMLFRFFFMSFIILFVSFRMFFGICVTINIISCPTPYTCLYLISNLVYPKSLLICSSSLIYLQVQPLQIMYLSFLYYSVIFGYIYLHLQTFNTKLHFHKLVTKKQFLFWQIIYQIRITINSNDFMSG